MSEQDVQERPDGFRPRRKRPKGWLKQAIKDGSVRDPKLGPEPHQTYRDDQHVIEVPVGTMSGTAEEN